MLEWAKALHEAIGIQSPKVFVLVFAFGGFIVAGFVGWMIDKGYRVKMAQEKPKVEQAAIVPQASHEIATLSYARPPQTTSHHKESHAQTPTISQQGQNNIAQIGNNNQAIINPKHPEPNIKWRTENVPVAGEGPYRVRIVMLLDQPMDDPGFHVVCDRPCTNDGAGTLGVSNSKAFELTGKPNETLVVFNDPNPIPPDVEIYWIILSKDANPINVLQLQRINPETARRLRRLGQ